MGSCSSARREAKRSSVELAGLPDEGTKLRMAPCCRLKEELGGGALLRGRACCVRLCGESEGLLSVEPCRAAALALWCAARAQLLPPWPRSAAALAGCLRKSSEMERSCGCGWKPSSAGLSCCCSSDTGMAANARPCELSREAGCVAVRVDEADYDEE